MLINPFSYYHANGPLVGVNIRPANGPFARWLKQQNVGCKSHYGGWDVSIRAFGQSHARKTAAAHAMAAVLRAADIKAYAYDRLD